MCAGRQLDSVVGRCARTRWESKTAAEADATVTAMEPVEVRRSSGARRWRLEVPWGEPARLTVPSSMGLGEIDSVVAEQRSWIEAQRRRQVPRPGLERLKVSEWEARTAARELASALVDDEAERIGVAYRRIRIGDQHTLWGSCSPSGSLSFNWRLVLAPPEVFDYVVVHELCHLRVPNHSQAFWTLVEQERPGWRASRRWLREYGPELLALRAS
jgi:predicted metal-dependent hydrolase